MRERAMRQTAAMLVLLAALLTGCTPGEVPTPTPSSAPPEGTLQGTVADGTMNTLTVEGEEGELYTFDIQGAEVSTGETGIVIRNPVTVVYLGALDDTVQEQTVEVRSVVVTDGVPSPEPTPTPEPTLEERAQAIVDGMSLEERVGQMFIARCPEEGAAQAAAEYHLGGYILFSRDFADRSREQIVAEIQSYQDSAAVPLLIGVDEEGGTVNRVSRNPALREEPFQSPQALYAEGGLARIQADTVEKCALLEGLGINLNFAPVCDVSTDPSDFMYDRAFGQDGAQTARYVETVVGAMAEEGMGSVLKHFPGYGDNEDTHTGIAYDNRPYEQFAASDFLPFRAGIAAGADVVLVSHNMVACMDEHYPASLSPEVHALLREELGFDGVIITDDLVMEGVHAFTGDEEAAVLAVLAGNDLLCCTDFETQYPAVLSAVQMGRIPEKQVEQSVLRIIKLKLKLGLL